MIDPWTSRPDVIDIVLEFFETTAKFVKSQSSNSDPSGIQKEPNDQLPELASVLFACIQERLGWLGR
jgi:nuclear pore complex protein Nup133